MVFAEQFHVLLEVFVVSTVQPMGVPSLSLFPSLFGMWWRVFFSGDGLGKALLMASTMVSQLRDHHFFVGCSTLGWLSYLSYSLFTLDFSSPEFVVIGPYLVVEWLCSFFFSSPHSCFLDLGCGTWSSGWF